MQINRARLFAALAFVSTSPMVAAEPNAAADAESMLQKAFASKDWNLGHTGEQFAWNINATSLHTFLKKYESTKDTAYLDAGVKYFDALLAKMETGPDGYKGFIGPFIYDNKIWCDVHVGDALLFDAVMDFAALAERDEKLKPKYGAKALEYTNITKREFFEKWDARGTWHEDGPYGYYMAWNKYGKPGEFKNWTANPDANKVENSIPFNKQIDCGVVAIRIWQITGDQKFKDRAERIFGHMKSRMQNYNGALHWNYWEPAGQGDFDQTKLEAAQWNPEAARDTIRHWTAVHPHRNYQAGEVANIVKAYNAGIVFTEADIKAIIHTNLKVMWNGDEKNPKFANSNVDLYKTIGQPETFADSTPQHQRAGTLWTALAPFDNTVRKLSHQGRVVNAEAPAPSFARTDVKGEVQTPAHFNQFPLGNVRTINMAAAMPTTIPLGERTMLACKLIEDGELEIALYSEDGKSKIATLKKGQTKGGKDGRDGVNYILWNGDLGDGKAATPGNYRIRYTVTGDGFREFPITIQPKK
jgi:hypothetical protein